MCSEITPPQLTQCNNTLGKTVLLRIKPYVYEVVNGGKIKRSSPFVFDESGTTIIEIKQRAIKGRFQ